LAVAVGGMVGDARSRLQAHFQDVLTHPAVPLAERGRKPGTSFIRLFPDALRLAERQNAC